MSFIEIQSLTGCSGEMSWYTKNNVLMWHCLSEDAIKSIQELVRTDKIIVTNTSPLVYMIDGFVPKEPLAKSMTRKYKTPKWMPIVFSLPKDKKGIYVKIEI